VAFRDRLVNVGTLAVCHSSVRLEMGRISISKFHQWVSSVLRPRQHSICYIWDTVSTGQKTQPTVSKYWRRCYKRERKQRKQL